MTFCKMISCGQPDRQLSDRGAVGGVEGMAFGVLLFVFGMLMVVNAWAIVDGNLAAAAAAREASRTMSERFAIHDDATTRAQSTAADVLRGYQPRAQNVRVTVSGVPEDGAKRCILRTVSVRFEMPMISLPLIDGAGGTRTVQGYHSEIVDPYRSGTPGTARCTA